MQCQYSLFCWLCLVISRLSSGYGTSYECLHRNTVHISIKSFSEHFMSGNFFSKTCFYSLPWVSVILVVADYKWNSILIFDIGFKSGSLETSDSLLQIQYLENCFPVEPGAQPYGSSYFVAPLRKPETSNSRVLGTHSPHRVSTGNYPLIFFLYSNSFEKISSIFCLINCIIQQLKDRFQCCTPLLICFSLFSVFWSWKREKIGKRYVWY